MSDNMLPRVTNFLRKHIDEPFELSTASGGLVHHVYKISTRNATYFLKVRGTSFVKMPSIVCNPEDIEYEFRALQYFYGAMPSSFPKVIVYDRDQAMILMTSVMTPDINLESLLNANNVSIANIDLIASRIAHVHSRMEAIDSPIRDNKEEEYYNNNLHYRLASLNRLTLKGAVEILKIQKRQIIFGDLSPKNMAVNFEGMYICDLDTAHYGNVLFDIGFFAGHLLLHTFKCRDNNMALRFITTYLNHSNLYIDQGDQDLLVRIMLGICLYRLDNRVVPYSLPNLSQAEKKILIARIDESLCEASLTLTRIARLKV